MFTLSYRNFIQIGSIRCKQLLVRPCSSTQAPVKIAHQPLQLRSHNVIVSGKVARFFDKENYVLLYSIHPNGFKISHKAVITKRNESLFDIAKTKLAVDQHVLIEGKLSSAQFYTDQGRVRNQVSINVAELTIGENNAFPEGDINSVELLGNVDTDVLKQSKFRTFSLKTLNKPGSSGQPSEYSMNRIFVYDEQLFPS